jgi:hypothetical protein
MKNMGYGTRDGSIRTFAPDDTETVKYLHSGCDYTLAEILDIAREKWGEKIGLEDITITAEYIHTDCIGYDLYDSGDYTNFIVITLQTPQA